MGFGEGIVRGSVVALGGPKLRIEPFKPDPEDENQDASYNGQPIESEMNVFPVTSPEKNKDCADNDRFEWIGGGFQAGDLR